MGDPFDTDKSAYDIFYGGGYANESYQEYIQTLENNRPTATFAELLGLCRVYRALLRTSETAYRYNAPLVVRNHIDLAYRETRNKIADAMGISWDSSRMCQFMNAMLEI